MAELVAKFTGPVMRSRPRRLAPPAFRVLFPDCFRFRGTSGPWTVAMPTCEALRAVAHDPQPLKLELTEMMKKSCLALALAAAATLVTTTAHAAIVSMDYAATVTGGFSVTGTVSWDTTSTGTSFSPSLTEFQAASVTLFINNVNYSGNLSNKRLWVQETGANQDQFTLLAGLSGVGPMPQADSLVIDLFDNEGGMFNGVGALPGSVSAFSGAETQTLRIQGFDQDTGDYLSWSGDVTISPTVVATPPVTPPTPSVPEPGSLLLVALAGLALGATRRRSTTA